MKPFSVALVLCILFHPGLALRSPAADPAGDALRTGRFKWTASVPLLSAANRPEDPCYSVKDPSIVRFSNRWHLFCTIRSEKRTHQIEYVSFGDWKDANAATRHVLAVTNGYYCAPQVFYFESHRMWYMIYQASDNARKVALHRFSQPRRTSPIPSHGARRCSFTQRTRRTSKAGSTSG